MDTCVLLGRKQLSRRRLYLRRCRIEGSANDPQRENQDEGKQTIVDARNIGDSDRVLPIRYIKLAIGQTLCVTRLLSEG